MEMSGQFHVWPLYPQGKSSRHHLDRRLGEPQSRYGRAGEEKNILPLSGIESYNPDYSARSLVAENMEVVQSFEVMSENFLTAEVVELLIYRPNSHQALSVLKYALKGTEKF
jgi:hypothetical protein